jgi:hypothetical protein
MSAVFMCCAVENNTDPTQIPNTAASWLIVNPYCHVHLAFLLAGNFGTNPTLAKRLPMLGV